MIREFFIHAAACIEMGALLTAISWHLKCDHFSRAVQLCTMNKKSDTAMSGWSEEQQYREVLLAQQIMRSVLRWYVFPNSCLHRALLACWFLARRGIPVHLVIATRKYPFAAHAWAEWNNLKLGDPLPYGAHPGSYAVVYRS